MFVNLLLCRIQATSNKLSCNTPFYDKIPVSKEINSHNTDSPLYEEVQENIKCTKCDAYELIKRVELQDEANKNNYSSINLPDTSTGSIYQFTTCSAYGNSENL